MSLINELHDLSIAIEEAIKAAMEDPEEKKLLFEQPRVALKEHGGYDLSPEIFVSVKECYECIVIRGDNRGGAILEIRYPTWASKFDSVPPADTITTRIECASFDTPTPTANRLPCCEETYTPIPLED